MEDEGGLKGLRENPVYQATKAQRDFFKEAYENLRSVNEKLELKLSKAHALATDIEAVLEL